MATPPSSTEPPEGNASRSSALAFPAVAVFVLTAGILGWVLVLGHARAVAADPWPSVVVVALAIVCAFIQVDVVAAGRHMTTFVFTDAAIVVALLKARPSSIPIALLATMATQVVRRRPPPVKVAVNLGHELLG